MGVGYKLTDSLLPVQTSLTVHHPLAYRMDGEVLSWTQVIEKWRFYDLPSWPFSLILQLLSFFRPLFRLEISWCKPRISRQLFQTQNTATCRVHFTQLDGGLPVPSTTRWSNWKISKNSNATPIRNWKQLMERSRNQMCGFWSKMTTTGSIRPATSGSDFARKLLRSKIGFVISTRESLLRIPHQLKIRPALAERKVSL